MAKWRFVDLTYSRFLKETFPGEIQVEDLWPDVRKTVIYEELKDWGIDAAKLPISQGELPGMSTTPLGEGMIGIGPSMRKLYPSDEATYIGLVHELSHLLQHVRGLHLETQEYRTPPTTARDWIESPIERDAIRWSARQAIAMGWSKQRFNEFMRTRYPGISEELFSSLAMAGLREFSPKTSGIVPLFRRPVCVRSHRRRR